MKQFGRLRHLVGSSLTAVAARAARAYVAGENLDDALRIAEYWAKRRIASTVGYFDSEEDDRPEGVAGIYASALRALGGTDNYVSIKLPALGFSRGLLREVAAVAAEARARLHFDAMWPESVDEIWRAIDEMLASGRCGPISCTLPGRWLRSLEDVQWVGQRQLAVRVVKGQWADPAAPDRDLRQGFLELVEGLAGRVSRVALASHDTPIVERAIGILQRHGTACEMELLHGLPMRQSILLARRLDVPVRVYVPFGKAHLPYAIKKVLGNPRWMWWLAKDLISAPFQRIIQ